MHWLFILVTSGLRFLRPCLQSILMDQRCSWQLQKSLEMTWYSGRGDAYCGMLNASYNLKLRNIKAYIPEYPVGNAEECADMIHEFVPVARAVYALSNLKIISFGPRPLNFLACNAPIKQLYNLRG